MKKRKSDIFAVVEQDGKYKTIIENLGKNIVISEWQGDSVLEGVVISVDKVRNLAFCLALLANDYDGGFYDPDDCRKCLVNM